MLPLDLGSLFKTIRRIEIKTKRSSAGLLAGTYRSIFKGRGMEFEEVREYIPGDDTRLIDWNVTARMNVPYVKRFREERDLNLMLLVDLSASTHLGSHGKSKALLITELAALLSFSAIQNQDRVGIILFSDQIEKYLPPKKGTRHVLRLIRDLLAFKARHRRTDIKKALSFLGKVERKKSICFLISDFISTQNYSKELALAARFHDFIAIGVSDPLEKQLPPSVLLNLRDLEEPLNLIVDAGDRFIQSHLLQTDQRRWNQLEELFKRLEISFIHLTTDQPYLSPLSRFFKSRIN